MNKKRNDILIGIYAVIKILDIATTFYAMDKLGIVEGNPFMKPFINNPYGKAFIIGWNIGLLTAMKATDYYIKKKDPSAYNFYTIGLMVLNIIGSYVVGHNLGVIYYANLLKKS